MYLNNECFFLGNFEVFEISCNLRSFLGSDLVDWLMEHVDGLRDRKDGRKFAGELLKEKLISHVVNKITFTEQCYYILGEECAGLFLGD